jgi:hypothetical protein
MLGSMVQKGKFSAVALLLESALKSVDLPTLGKPMMPYLRAIKKEDYGGSEKQGGN